MSKKRPYHEDMSPGFFLAGKEKLDEYDRAVASNRHLLFLTAAFFFLTVLSYWGYSDLASKMQVSIQMPGYKEMKVSQNDASDEFFRVWGEYLIGQASNFDPDNVSNRMFNATKLMKKFRYLEEKPKFEKFILGIKTNNVSQRFVIDLANGESGVKRLKTGQVEFWQKGIAHQKIGKKTSIEKRCEYKVVLYIEGGVPYEDAISSNCFSGPNDKL